MRALRDPYFAIIARWLAFFRSPAVFLSPDVEQGPARRR